MYQGKSAGKLHIKTEFKPYEPGQLAKISASGDQSKKEAKVEPKVEPIVEVQPSEPAVIENGGSLKILIIEARLTHDTETFGKMDQYVEIKTSKGT